MRNAINAAIHSYRRCRRAQTGSRTYQAIPYLCFGVVGAYLLLLSFPEVLLALASPLNDDRALLVGNWLGESLCAGDHPACHDEKVVYRIALSPGDGDTVIITMDKIVAGKPDTMAVLNFKYDREQGTLVNEFTRRTTHGRWEFTVQGNKITGTLLILPEKTVARRVQVTKEG
jgi:hypothetical protein